LFDLFCWQGFIFENIALKYFCKLFLCFLLHLFIVKNYFMSLLSQNKNKGKKGAKNGAAVAGSVKSFAKQAKAMNVGKKPIKTGGARGS
jgi:hypothetical protein